MDNPMRPVKIIKSYVACLICGCFVLSFEKLLYKKKDLSDGMHTVVLSNDPDAGTVSSVDIDFITWTSNDKA